MSVTARTFDDIPLFLGLPDNLRAALARECTWKRYSQHEQIFDRDDNTRDVYFVVSGKLRVVNYSLSGREISFDDIDSGGFFGELAAIDGAPRSASVLTLIDTQVAIMSHPLFMKIITEHPTVALRVMHRLTGVIRQATGRIMDLSTLGANNRVHAEILRLARPDRTRAGVGIIRPIPPHHDVASRVSTTRETVARVFGDLSKAGLVERHSDHLCVTDLQELELMVENVRG